MTDSASNPRHLVAGLLAAGLAGVLGVTVWSWQGAWRGQGSEDDRPLEGLKIFWPVPDFSLIECGGRRITLADLRGKVWIANFIYTHCTDTCPLQTTQMAVRHEGAERRLGCRSRLEAAVLLTRWGEAPRTRAAGPGSKPPDAAPVQRPGW